MKIDIDKLSYDELAELNHKVVERLRFLDSMHHHNEMMKFNIGAKVSFDPPGRGKQVGTLVKFNKKSVTVITEGGQKWTVAPNLLSKVLERNGANDRNVIELKQK
jgi:hypothetical protein